MNMLREHGPTGAIFWRFGRGDMQPLPEAIGNPRREASDAHARTEQEAREREYEDQLRRTAQQQNAEQEARRPVCARCSTKFTNERWRAIEPADWGTLRDSHPRCVMAASAGRSTPRARPSRLNATGRSTSRMRPCPSNRLALALPHLIRKSPSRRRRACPGALGEFNVVGGGSEAGQYRRRALVLGRLAPRRGVRLPSAGRVLGHATAPLLGLGTAMGQVVGTGP